MTLIMLMCCKTLEILLTFDVWFVRKRRNYTLEKTYFIKELHKRMKNLNICIYVSPGSSKSCSFRCIFDGTCIPKEWQCNGFKECSRGEDEYMCQTTTEVDRPPHAVTSADMILQYPQTSCTLYGDRSTDDHGIVKYIWTKTSATALSCDMQGTHTSTLHLSNLQVGVYVFRLTVVDKLGQTSTADVHVTVEQGSPYRMPTTKEPKSTTCGYHEIYCYVTRLHRDMCLHNMYKCDGNKDCADGKDEDPIICGDTVCNRRLEESVGWFTSPNFPNAYPGHSSCSWVIHKQASSPGSTIQLRVVSFALDYAPDDYVKVYDGPDNTYKLIGAYYGSKKPPPLIESTSNWLNVVFKSGYFNRYKGFNFTYQIKGQCLPTQSPCMGENDCFDSLDERCNGVWNCQLNGSDEKGCGKCLLTQSPCVGENTCYDSVSDRCNGLWDCPLYGSDEKGCENCKKDDYTCGKRTSQCYNMSERCNGLARCSNSMDETNCTPTQCGTHNGTFLCDNGRCIYESWTCDERDDCGDNSDEKFCSGTTKRVVIAAICGSMVCALLLVILLGCSCKLYSLRTMDHHHQFPRHETPMSRLYAEFLRRRAPPPYHEAMLTSRNFDEVQQEYLDRMRNSRRQHRGSRGNRRRSRNQQNQSQRDDIENNENQASSSNNNNESLHEGTSGVQLSTINEETENENNVNTDRTSSTAELLPSESESESDDLESETDLVEQGEGHSDGQSGSNRSDHRSEVNNIVDDDDDENILASTSLSMQWRRNVDSDDSSDDVCILDSLEDEHTPQAHSSGGQGPYITIINVSADTAATASIASSEEQEVPNDLCLFKDSENELDSDENVGENSHNSTPKPDNNHGNSVISETSGGYIRRNSSQGSLNSIGSETHSENGENDVPLLPMNSVSQHF